MSIDKNVIEAIKDEVNEHAAEPTVRFYSMVLMVVRDRPRFRKHALAMALGNCEFVQPMVAAAMAGDLTEYRSIIREINRRLATLLETNVDDESLMKMCKVTYAMAAAVRVIHPDDQDSLGAIMLEAMETHFPETRNAAIDPDAVQLYMFERDLFMRELEPRAEGMEN